MTSEICSRAINRLFNENEDFNEVLRENKGSPTWFDKSFPFSEAIYWEEMRVKSQDDYSWIDSYADWMRLSDVFDGDKYSLWGYQGIKPADVIQGGLGDS